MVLLATFFPFILCTLYMFMYFFQCIVAEINHWNKPPVRQRNSTVHRRNYTAVVKHPQRILMSKQNRKIKNYGKNLTTTLQKNLHNTTTNPLARGLRHLNYVTWVWNWNRNVTNVALVRNGNARTICHANKVQLSSVLLNIFIKGALS